MIFEQQALWNYPKQTYGASDFRDDRAQILASQANKKASSTKKVSKRAVDCFSKLSDCCKDFPKKLDPNTCSLKMLRTFLALREAGALPECSIVFGHAGMTVNGNCSTLNTPILWETNLSTEYLRIGKEYLSLADLLEQNADKKYFLSQEQMNNILMNCDK